MLFAAASALVWVIYDRHFQFILPRSLGHIEFPVLFKRGLNLHLTLAVLIYSAGGSVAASWVFQTGEAI